MTIRNIRPPFSERALRPHVGKPVCAVLNDGTCLSGVVAGIRDGHLILDAPRPHVPEQVKKAADKLNKRNHQRPNGNRPNGRRLAGNRPTVSGFGFPFGYPLGGFGFGGAGLGFGGALFIPLFLLSFLFAGPFYRWC